MRPKPLTRRPVVTVVIPCYNYGRFLPTAVGSVLEQPGVDVELIVIDDASPDGSAAAVQRVASRDERIRTILHPENRGHIATYNEGLEQANGDYVVLLSADDALTPGSLARAAAIFEAHPSVGLVYGHPEVFSDQLPRANLKVRNWTIWTGQEWVERRCRTGRNCIINPEVVMRTSVLHAIGGYDPRLPHSGDLEMWLRAAAVADVGRVNGAAQGFYRIHGDSMQRTTNAGHMIDLQGRLDAFRKVLIGPEARMSRGEVWFAAAKRALALCALGCARSAYDYGRAEPVDKYMEFAISVWPDIRRTHRWRSLARRAVADSDRSDRGLHALTGRIAEDLRWRVRWRRWRWTGV